MITTKWINKLWRKTRADQKNCKQKNLRLIIEGIDEKISTEADEWLAENPKVFLVMDKRDILLVCLAGDGTQQFLFGATEVLSQIEIDKWLVAVFSLA